jgi:hypothetical protein
MSFYADVIMIFLAKMIEQGVHEPTDLEKVMETKYWRIPLIVPMVRSLLFGQMFVAPTVGRNSLTIRESKILQ